MCDAFCKECAIIKYWVLLTSIVLTYPQMTLPLWTSPRTYPVIINNVWIWTLIWTEPSYKYKHNIILVRPTQLYLIYLSIIYYCAIKKLNAYLVNHIKRNHQTKNIEEIYFKNASLTKIKFNHTYNNLHKLYH